MKIESLNIWGGRVFDPLTQHLQKQGESIDIFCLQEVYSTPLDIKYTREATNEDEKLSNVYPARANIYEEIVKALPNHVGYYRPALDRADYQGVVDYELYFGLAIFVKRGIQVKKEDDIFVFLQRGSFIPGDNTTCPRNLQYVQVEKDGNEYTIANLHGIWTGGGKNDTPSRMEQSQKIKTFFSAITGAKILCGDFNLLPETESLTILEGNMSNLVKEYGITSTRSEFYTKPEKFADYILVSPEVEVSDFKVLQDPVSDHLPLQAEFV
jgi:endonuclease/exonuclease/phosphatase family metal-dependent hydrolase